VRRAAHRCTLTVDATRTRTGSTNGSAVLTAVKRPVLSPSAALDDSPATDTTPENAPIANT
jgi:hypothetical protein